MKVTIDIPNFAAFVILGITPEGEDLAEVGGDSRLAYLPEGHPFTGPFRWHDAAYLAGSAAQLDGMPRWKIDRVFMGMMLQIAEGDIDLEEQAQICYMLVRKYGAKWWEGVPDRIVVRGSEREEQLAVARGWFPESIAMPSLSLSLA